VVPFITEALWQRLPGRRSDELLATASWPRSGDTPAEGAAEFELARDVVTAIRQLRNDNKIQPGRSVGVTVVPSTDAARAVLEGEADIIAGLARATVTVSGSAPSGATSSLLTADGSSVVLSLAGAVDLEKECARVRGELEQLVKQLGALETRLADERFLSRAKAEVVQAEREKAREWAARRSALEVKVKELCGA
jgi:valyl-tRNA synthetase